jgi:LIM domain
MRARNQVYHVDCFRCVACGRHLVPGDEFALSDEGLLCRADHDSITLDRHPSGVATGAGGLLKTSVLSPPDSVASGDDVISYGNNNNNNNNDSLAMGKFCYRSLFTCQDIRMERISGQQMSID